MFLRILSPRGIGQGTFLGLASSLQTVTMAPFQCGVACSRLDEHLTMLRMTRIVEHAAHNHDKSAL
jgi:hypothetical protein